MRRIERTKVSRKSAPRKYNRDAEFEELYNNFEDLFCHAFWGFEVGPGWFNIIADFVIKLDSHLRRNPDMMREEYIIMQIKEKFGSLRIYLHSSDFYINSLIAETEKRAADCCTICGKKVEKVFGVWSSMCEKHIKEIG